MTLLLGLAQLLGLATGALIIAERLHRHGQGRYLRMLADRLYACATGECLNESEDGFYGSLYEKLYLDTCWNLQCKLTTRRCLYGGNHGLFGALCDRYLSNS